MVSLLLPLLIVIIILGWIFINTLLILLHQLSYAMNIHLPLLILLIEPHHHPHKDNIHYPTDSITTTTSTIIILLLNQSIQPSINHDIDYPYTDIDQCTTEWESMFSILTILNHLLSL